MTLKTLQNELAKLQKKAGKIEGQIKSRLTAQFNALPGRVGLKSIDHLIEALRPYSKQSGAASSASSQGGTAPTGKRRGRPPGRPAGSGTGAKRRGRPPGSGKQVGAKRRGRPPGSGAAAKTAAAKTAAPKTVSASAAKGASSTRNRYSETVKAAIRKDLEKGGKTFNQLSKEYGPSVFSIKDWKKSWGLTKARKKKAA